MIWSAFVVHHHFSNSFFVLNVVWRWTTNKTLIMLASNRENLSICGWRVILDRVESEMLIGWFEIHIHLGASVDAAAIHWTLILLLSATLRLLSSVVLRWDNRPIVNHHRSVLWFHYRALLLLLLTFYNVGLGFPRFLYSLPRLKRRCAFTRCTSVNFKVLIYFLRCLWFLRLVDLWGSSRINHLVHFTDCTLWKT
jgi:hypothetical protein